MRRRKEKKREEKRRERKRKELKGREGKGFSYLFRFHMLGITDKTFPYQKRRFDMINFIPLNINKCEADFFIVRVIRLRIVK